MKRPKTAAVIRTLILLGILAILCVVLQRQWKPYAEYLQREKQEQSLRTNQTIKGKLDQLTARHLQTARAKAPEIASLRKKKSRPIATAELAVPRINSAWTRTGLREEHLRYRQRELSAYRKLTKDPPSAKETGETFLKKYLHDSVYFDEDSANPARNLALGQSALDAGSRDPLLRLFFWVTHSKVHPDVELATRELTAALTELESVSYPRVLEVYGWSRLAEIDKGREFSKETVQRKEHLQSAIVRWLEEEHAHAEWQIPVYDRLWRIWRDLPENSLDTLLMRLAQSPNIDEYIIHLLSGDMNFRQAWRSRGADYYANLTTQQRQGFQQYGKQASDHLQYAWFLRPDLPYASSPMIQLEMARLGPGETPYFWFLRSTEAQFDYHPAYSAMLIALLPEWGGSEEQAFQFVKNCVETGQFTTTVPYIAMEALTALDERGTIDLPKSAMAQALLRKFVDDRDRYRESHPGAHLFEDYGGYSAELLHLLEDSNLYSLAVHQAHVTETVDDTVLQSDGRPGKYLRLRWLAATEDSIQSLVQFDEKLRGPLKTGDEQQQLAWLAADFHERKRLPAWSDAAAYYLNQVDTILDQRRRFFDGEWVELPIAAGMSGWETYADVVSIQDDDSVQLTGQNLKSKRIGLRPLANFPPPLEIEATIENQVPAELLVAGIAWARDGRTRLNLEGLCPVMGIESGESLLPNDVRNRTEFVRISGLSKISSDVNNFDDKLWLGSKQSHRLHLKLWPSAAEFWADQMFWRSIPFQSSLDPRGYLYLGIQQFDRRKNVAVKIGQVRVRRLEMKSPPSTKAPFQERLEYWEQRYQTSHEDRVAVSRLCGLRFDQQRFDEVIAMADAYLKESPDTIHIRIWKARALFETYQDTAAFAEIPAIFKEPDDEPEASILAAQILATTIDDSIRDGRKAIDRATSALQQFPNGKHACGLAALAAANAEIGNFQEAIRVHDLAMQVATESEKAQLEPRKSLYESGEPYRHKPPNSDESAR